jgi:lactoylglutathione lyase
MTVVDPKGTWEVISINALMFARTRKTCLAMTCPVLYGRFVLVLLGKTIMRIAHTALWTRDLERAAHFFETYFGATVGDAYHSKNRVGFTSRFARLPGAGDLIELMSGPWVSGLSAESVGWDHIAIALGSEDAVVALAEKCKTDGCLRSGPRWTGDGFFEAVILMPDGTPVEITV